MCKNVVTSAVDRVQKGNMAARAFIVVLQITDVGQYPKSLLRAKSKGCEKEVNHDALSALY